MKKTWKAALAAAAVLGSAQIAKADLTLNSESGLFLNPTGEIVEKKAPEIQLSYVNNAAKSATVKRDLLGLGGAMQVAKGLELNGQTGKYGGAQGAKQWYVGLKYQLLSSQEKGAYASLGLRYMGTSADSKWKGYTAYLAGTKAFGHSEDRAPVKVTLGLRYDHASYFSYSNSKVNAFGGVEVPITAKGDFKAIGEFGVKHYSEASSSWDLGIRWTPSNKGFNIGVGYGNTGENASGFFVQAGYKFGK